LASHLSLVTVASGGKVAEFSHARVDLPGDLGDTRKLLFEELEPLFRPGISPVFGFVGMRPYSLGQSFLEERIGGGFLEDTPRPCDPGQQARLPQGVVTENVFADMKFIEKALQRLPARSALALSRFVLADQVLHCVHLIQNPLRPIPQVFDHRSQGGTVEGVGIEGIIR